MAVNLATGFNRTTGEPIDVLYLATSLIPYASVVAANTAIVSTVRYVGQFVNIGNELYWYKNGITDPDLVAFTSGGGGGIAFTSVTYADLEYLIATSALVQGNYYLINDYQTIYDQPDYDAAGNPKPSVTTNTGSVEPLIVQASSVNQINQNAISTLFPLDVIQYDVTFTQTEVMNQPAKGRIILRTDDNNNTTNYDHRQVLFKRYERTPSSGIYNVVRDNGNPYIDNIPTFGTGCYSNKIGNFYTTLDINNTGFILSNNIFDDDCWDNTTGADFYNNTIGSIVYENKFGDLCHDNIIDGDAYNNVINNNFSLNTIGSQFYNNSILNGFRLNIIGSQFQGNEILSGFRENTTSAGFAKNRIGYDFRNVGIAIGTNFLDNQIGNNFSSNVAIGNNFQSNIIGTNFSLNSIGNEFFSNEIKDGFQQNNVGDSFSLNKIVNDFVSNTIGYLFCANQIGTQFGNNTIGGFFGYNISLDLLAGNVIGNQFTDNNIGDNFYNNQIGNFFQYNEIATYFLNNQIANYFQTNTIADYFGTDLDLFKYGNVIGDWFQNNTTLGVFAQNKIGNLCGGSPEEGAKPNTFGDNCFSNRIEDYFWNNTVGDNFNFNTIQNYFSVNNINADFSSNQIGNNFFSNTIANGFQTNQIGNNFSYNIIDSSFQYNTIASYFKNNTIGNYFNSNSIGDFFTFNFIGDYFGTDLTFNTLGNTIGDTFTFNFIAPTFNNNSVKNFCVGNTISATVTFNYTPISGAFTIGEEINNGTLSTTAQIISNTGTSMVVAYFTSVFQIGQTLTGVSSGATATLNSITVAYPSDPTLTKNNDIGNDFTSNVIVNNFRNNIYQAPTVAVDYTLATHVYQTYTCIVFTNAASTQRLSYYDTVDVLTITAPNS